MSSAVSPLSGPLSRRDVPAMRALLTATPVLANTPLNSNAPDLLPLTLALRAGYLPEAQLLRTFNARSSGPALVAAAVSCDVATLAWVLDSGLDTDVSNTGIAPAALGSTQSTITPAAKLAAISFLLDKGVPAQGMFQLAVQLYPAVVKLLIARSVLTPADLVEVKPDTPLFPVVYNLKPHPLTYALLPDGSNALFVAINDQADLAPLLAAVPGRLNTVLPYVGTPLHFALASGNLVAATTLVAHGADVGYALPTGETALGAAARGRSAACVAFIASAIRSAAGPATLTLAANTVDRTVRGRIHTPLVRAAVAYAPPAVFTALLDAGANPNLECEACPPVSWLGWAAMDRHAAAAAVPLGWDPTAAMRILVETATAYPKPNIDISLVPLQGKTARQFNADFGIAI